MVRKYPGKWIPNSSIAFRTFFCQWHLVSIHPFSSETLLVTYNIRNQISIFWLCDGKGGCPETNALFLSMYVTVAFFPKSITFLGNKGISLWCFLPAETFLVFTWSYLCSYCWRRFLKGYHSVYILLLKGIS